LLTRRQKKYFKKAREEEAYEEELKASGLTEEEIIDKISEMRFNKTKEELATTRAKREAEDKARREAYSASMPKGWQNPYQVCPEVWQELEQYNDMPNYGDNSPLINNMS
jgi:hypothetical protein